ncbi:MAG: SlyX family protein [Myxococcota bacterium]
MDDRDEIEAKLAWLEKYVVELDGVVRGLADEVVTLRRELGDLRAARAAAGEDDADAGGSITYEKPPHY